MRSRCAAARASAFSSAGAGSSGSLARSSETVGRACRRFGPRRPGGRRGPAARQPVENPVGRRRRRKRMRRVERHQHQPERVLAREFPAGTRALCGKIAQIHGDAIWRRPGAGALAPGELPPFFPPQRRPRRPLDLARGRQRSLVRRDQLDCLCRDHLIPIAAQPRGRENAAGRAGTRRTILWLGQPARSGHACGPCLDSSVPKRAPPLSICSGSNVPGSLRFTSRNNYFADTFFQGMAEASMNACSSQPEWRARCAAEHKRIENGGGRLTHDEVIYPPWS